MSDIKLGLPVGPTERFPLASRQRVLSRIYFLIALAIFSTDIFKLTFGDNPYNGLDFLLVTLSVIFFMFGFLANRVAARVEIRTQR